uniref:HMG box domain-containing protein n=1 Tax=Salix viminalis TaxID=40686 RepID=A0A6N2MJX9_SALVM
MTHHFNSSECYVHQRTDVVASPETAAEASTESGRPDHLLLKQTLETLCPSHHERQTNDAKLKRKGAGAGTKASRKAAKDPNKPKRPASAFFMEDFRKQYKEAHLNNKFVAAVGKAGGDKWNHLLACQILANLQRPICPSHRRREETSPFQARNYGFARNQDIPEQHCASDLQAFIPKAGERNSSSSRGLTETDIRLGFIRLRQDEVQIFGREEMRLRRG